MIDLRKYIFRKDRTVRIERPEDGGHIYYDSTLDEAYDIGVNLIHRFKNNALAKYNKYSNDRIESLKIAFPHLEHSHYMDRITTSFEAVSLILEDEKNAQLVLQLMMGSDEPFEKLQEKLLYSIFSPSFTISGSCISLAACYAIDPSDGLTKDLASSKIQTEMDLYKSLTEIWNNAQQEIHPFQWGHTHQGSKHCGRVYDNLGLLKDKINPSFTNKDFGLLSIACAIHDVAKVDTIRSSNQIQHATEAKKIALQSHRNPLLLDLLDQSDREMVSDIVRAHNNELTSAKIIEELTKNMPDQVAKEKIEKLLSIFQLADIMDTTHKRVSEPLKDILWLLHVNTPPIANDPSPPNYSNKTQRLLDKSRGRVNIDTIDVVDDSHGGYFIEVKPMHFCLPGTPELSDVVGTVNYDNGDLTGTGAKDILENANWPFELRVS